MRIDNPLPADKTVTPRKGLLARLRADTRGNTLAIVGAALIPLTAMIGSGVDMSRAYMAKTRLQSACDAASLAGRRVMQNDTVNQAVIDEATRFFRFNFPVGLYNTANFTPQVTRPSAGTVRVAANTTIPTTVMGMFGFTNLPLEVSCDASLNFVNTDVMLVLDITGSMDWDINGNWTNDDDERRVTAMRQAVMALYDELAPIQTQLESNGLRLRYGVVPYSSTVNVGTLIRSASPNYLADSTQYQSRVGNYENYRTNVISDTQVTQTYPNSLTQAECNLYAVNQGYPTLNGQPAATGGPPPEPVTNVTYSLRDWGGTNDTSGSQRTCRRYKRVQETQTGYFSDNYTYRQVSIDTSQYKLGNPVTIATNDDGATEESGELDMVSAANLSVGVGTTQVTWNGCIEERGTVDTITPASGYNVPTGAYDLNINLIPYDENTRWKPMWGSVVYRRNDNGSRTNMAGSACPYPARRLQAWTRTAMQNYINQLDPVGSTYHDIGMIWGARMISNAGIFADSPDTFAGMPVARHIIFMSDGQMDTDRTIYAFHGIERHDQRVSGMSSPSEAELNGRHMQRFKMACNAAKSLNASIWVIAFGTSLSAEMLECASNANQASTAGNRDQLIARFRQIGSNIGALRLTQ